MDCRLLNRWGWEPTSPDVSESIVAPAKERYVVCTGWGTTGLGWMPVSSCLPRPVVPTRQPTRPQNAQQLFTFISQRISFVNRWSSQLLLGLQVSFFVSTRHPMSAGLSWLPKLCTVTHTAAASTQDGAELATLSKRILKSPRWVVS